MVLFGIIPDTFFILSIRKFAIGCGSGWTHRRFTQYRNAVSFALVKKISIFRFKKNIHQLPREDFLDCLYELFFRDEQVPGDAPDSLRNMLLERFGKGIAERFLIPYNQKVYACDLRALDRDGMGRFFPQADVASIVRNIKVANNASYNAVFEYPEGGAEAYIHALLRDLPQGWLCCGERLLSVNLKQRIATTSKRQIRFETLVSSRPH